MVQPVDLVDHVVQALDDGGSEVDRICPLERAALNAKPHLRYLARSLKRPLIITGHGIDDDVRERISLKSFDLVNPSSNHG